MRRLIDWFVESPVAANLLMVFVIVAGILTFFSIRHEVFPDVAPDMILASVAWPGASPEEVEEGICVKIEEAIEGLEGVKRITSTAAEGLGVVRVELHEGVPKGEVLDDVKARVDAISTFPGEAERPVVKEAESPNIVVSVVVSGRTDPLTLKRIARDVRDGLAALPDVSRVEITNAVDYEVSVEVSEEALRRHGLGFDEVARAVREGALNLSGGTIRTKAGEIAVRSDNQAYTGPEFERLTLLRGSDGARIPLGGVAEVVDGLADVPQWSTFDGEPALTITVWRIGKQGAPEVAAAVLRFLEAKRAELPEGIRLTPWRNWADLLEQRFDLLLKNGKWGLLLIFLVLALFLRLRLAFWVAIGIPTALLGAVWMLPGMDTTINMMSLFAFILVLGILVDDAIVVGENIHHHNRLGRGGRAGAKAGVHEVMLAVVLSVLTTIAAFIPMATLPGVMGRFAGVIPVVVIAALTFSLVESLLILPRHLSHGKAGEPARPRGAALLWSGLPALFARGLDAFVARVYRPALAFATRWRYLTIASGAALILLTAALFGGGFVRFSFFPPIAGDQIVVTLAMQEGTAAGTTAESIGRIQDGIEAVRRRHETEGGPRVLKHVLVSVGTQPYIAERNWERGGGAPSGSHLGEVFVELHPPERRGEIRPEDLMREIREAVGEIPGARELRYETAIHGLGAPLNVQLAAGDLGALRAAAERLKERLRGFEGVFDIADDLLAGKRELRLAVKPEGEALGLTQGELARQVRQAFHGEEARRIQRGKDDVKVMVRYPEADRRTLATFAAMRIRPPGGGEVPLAAVASLDEGRGPAAIQRADGGRVVTVTADVDLAAANTNEIAAELRSTVLPELVVAFPGLRWSFEGEQREQADTLGGLFRGSVLALLLIYTLLALAFGSFIQPVIVLTAIPFGMVGAVLGHFLLGLDLTLLSAIGLLAMSGVVVNDSLILVDFTNRERASGSSIRAAILEAGPRRFRPVLLTSLTTFAGLTPLLLETSVQAQFLIPMAVSLSFGVLFSTFVTLLLVPAFYLILEDLAALLRRALGRGPAGQRGAAGG